MWGFWKNTLVGLFDICSVVNICQLGAYVRDATGVDRLSPAFFREPFTGDMACSGSTAGNEQKHLPGFSNCYPFDPPRSLTENPKNGHGKHKTSKPSEKNHRSPVWFATSRRITATIGVMLCVHHIAAAEIRGPRSKPQSFAMNSWKIGKVMSSSRPSTDQLAYIVSLIPSKPRSGGRYFGDFSCCLHGKTPYNWGRLHCWDVSFLMAFVQKRSFFC